MQLTLAPTRSQRPIFAFVLLASLIVALVTATLFIGSARLTTSPYRNGAIVFEQGGDLFIADELDGTPRTLVAGPDVDKNPAFSPVGDRVAFVRDGPARDGRYPDQRVMVVDLDGTDVTELASGMESIDLELSWAPDGSALLANGLGTNVPAGDGEAVMGVGRDSRRMFLIEGDGSDVRMIDAGPDLAVGPGAWRPNGRQIAFLGMQDGVQLAFIADGDGTNGREIGPTHVGNTSGIHDGLAWSPDGTQLTFAGSRPTIADIDADGSMTGWHELALDPGTHVLSAPTWSADGSHVALQVYTGSEVRVAVLGSDGSDFRLMGPGVVDIGDAGFAWAPDGRSLVITTALLREDPDTQTHRWISTSWSVDVATGEETEVQTPVETWQLLAP